MTLVSAPLETLDFVTATAVSSPAATNSMSFSCVFRDASGWLTQPGGGQYNVTVTQTGASVAGTVNAIDIQVDQ